MKTFLINLNRNQDRLTFMDAQLRQLGIHYERIAAVDGKQIPVAERKRIFSSFRWWCEEGRPASLGEIGCCMSHLEIYRRMINDNTPYCFVLEDDVKVNDEVLSVLYAVEQWLQAEKPQVVLLSNDTDVNLLAQGKIVHVNGAVQIISSKRGVCTDGYCITLAAAKKLIKLNFPMMTPCDNWDRWARSKAIQLYHALPTVIRQQRFKFGSITGEGREDITKRKLLGFIAHKAKRVIGVAIDRVLETVTGR